MYVAITIVLVNPEGSTLNYQVITYLLRLTKGSKYLRNTLS